MHSTIKLMVLSLLASPLAAQTVPATSGTCTPAMSKQTYVDSTGASVTVINNVKVGEACTYSITVAQAGVYTLSVLAATTNPTGAAMHLEQPLGTNLSGPVSFPTAECCVGSAPTHFYSANGSNSFLLPSGTSTVTLVVDPTGGAAVGSGAHINIESFTLTYVPPTPPLYSFALTGCCTVDFPMASAPVCTPADGTCSIAIQVCDLSNHCFVSTSGTISLIKTVTLPTPQTLTVPVAVAHP